MHQAPLVAPVVRLHIEEAAALHSMRTSRAASVINLNDLIRIDNRIASHLDGISVAGEEAWPLLDAALDSDRSSTLFPNAVISIERKEIGRLQRLLMLAEPTSGGAEVLLAAFEWIEAERLEGIVARLLRSQSTIDTLVGIGAASKHRVDPGIGSERWIDNENAQVRAAALRASGEIGRRELLPWCTAATADENSQCRFWAGWSSVMLGDRHTAIEILRQTATVEGALKAPAFRLALQAMPVDRAHAFLKQVPRSPENLRWLIEGSGIAGDSAYVPWLLAHMAVPETARVAAEAFTTITGLNLFQGFDVPRSESVDGGPSENPKDENVNFDPEEGLPWPDHGKIQSWWAKNEGRFQKGARYFMGAPVTREHCIDVLKNGYQRQRILAAHYLCLLKPGTPLFNTSAPAWRQQKLLAQM